jgi:NAD(P)-dependent dehydrogenase (short-subunit alcohol dehydrogenase family)
LSTTCVRNVGAVVGVPTECCERLGTTLHACCLLVRHADILVSDACSQAGTGLAHGVDAATIMNTNLQGPRRVTEAFLPLLDPSGRVVNVGSGAGGGYVKKAPPEIQRQLCVTPESWAQIEGIAVQMLGSPSDTNSGYGLSKACLAAYTMLCAQQMPNITFSCSERAIASKAPVSL